MSKKAKSPRRPLGGKSTDPVTGASISGTWSTVGSTLQDGGLPWHFGGTFSVLKVTKGSTPYNTYYSLIKDALNTSVDSWRVTGYADSNRNGKFGDSSNDIVGNGTLRVINRSLAPAIAEIPASETILSGTFTASGNRIDYFIGSQLVASAVYETSPWKTAPIGF